ncbi:MAG: hypothetical protein SXV54_02865 [Chloroflexota bacterium]|nr:hypothetical protein [Chloroflexota bacterium]
MVKLRLGSRSLAQGMFATGHFLPNALIPDAATCCDGLVAQTNSANRIFVGQKRQQVGASVEVSGSEKACKFSREANTTDRRRFMMRRHTARWNRANVLVALVWSPLTDIPTGTPSGPETSSGSGT